MFYLCLILVCGGVVALDQLVKTLVVANIPLGGYAPAIPGIVHLTYLRNTGAAFSMLEGQRTFFLILTAVFLIGIVVCVVRKLLPRPYLWILAAITGGAIGNLIDRTLNGYVVDMFALDFWIFKDFAVFNVADLFITFGAAVLCIYALFFDKEDPIFKKKEKPHDDPL